MAMLELSEKSPGASVHLAVWAQSDQDSGDTGSTREQETQNEISSSIHIIKMFLNRPSS